MITKVYPSTTNPGVNICLSCKNYEQKNGTLKRKVNFLYKTIETKTAQKTNSSKINLNVSPVPYRYRSFQIQTS